MSVGWGAGDCRILVRQGSDGSHSHALALNEDFEAVVLNPQLHL